MVQQAVTADCRILAEMAVEMWDSHSIEDLEAEFCEMMDSGNTVFFLKYAADQSVGFAQCSLRRDYVEGTQTSPVGYLEGIFVKKGYREQGYAGELLQACEAWAKEKGCLEFASDCELDNTDSLQFHLATGFQEANRIICFRKNL